MRFLLPARRIVHEIYVTDLLVFGPLLPRRDLERVPFRAAAAPAQATAAAAGSAHLPVYFPT